MRIPNIPSKSSDLADIAEPEDGDWQIADKAHLLEGVREARSLVVPAADQGCVVSAGGLMMVDVSAGIVTINGWAIPVVAVVGLAVGAADPTDPRFDFVVASNAGVVSVIAGTASSNPVFPARVAQGGPVPDDSVVLASLYITAGLATIVDAPEADSHITDKRVILREPHSAPAMEWGAGQIAFGLPGWQIASFSTQPAFVAFPGVVGVAVYVARTMTFDRMLARVITGGGGTTLSLGIYTSVDDGNCLRPDRLIVDAGSVPSTADNTTHIITLLSALTLTPGYYYVAGAASGAISLRTPSATGIHTLPVTGEGVDSDITTGLGFERIVQIGSAAALPALPDPFGLIAGIPLLASNQVAYGFFLGRTQT